MKTITIKTKLPKNLHIELKKIAELQGFDMDELFEEMAVDYINLFNSAINDPIGDETAALIMDMIGLPPEEPEESSNVISFAAMRARQSRY